MTPDREGFVNRDKLAVEIGRAWIGLPLNAGELSQNYPQEQACYRVADMVLALLAAERERCCKMVCPLCCIDGKPNEFGDHEIAGTLRVCKAAAIRKEGRG